MPNHFTLPPMGESFTSGTIAKVLVSPGETVEEETPVLELETEKSVQEVPSTVSGKVGKILVQAGDQIKVGDPIFEIEGAGGEAGTGEEAKAVPAAQAEATPTVEAKAEEQAPKADNEATSFADTQGMASKNGGAGSNGQTATGVATNGIAEGAPANGRAPFIPQLTSLTRELIPAAPSVRRIARELGIDIRQVKGTGPDNRISASDVQSFARGGGLPVAGGVGVAPLPLPDFSRWGEVERQPMSGIRRATSDQMTRSWATVPHVTQFDKTDITNLERLRKQYGKAAEAAGTKLTVTAIALKIAAAALKKFPHFNASIDMASHEVVLKKYIHIGVAVDTDHGLLVPVIRDVDRKNIVELAVELNAVAERARSRKISLDEMQGGCFTVTNLGGIGGTGFTPIVNTPEVAILGIARGSMEPVWNGTTFEPRMMLPLSLSYDHRAIDGADGARFLRWIASAMEEPFLMSLEG